MGKGKHTLSSFLELGTRWRNQLCPEEKKMWHQNQKNCSHIQKDLLEEGRCVSWNGACPALLQEQRSDKEGARTWKGMEEMDGISYQGGGDERMCEEIEESKWKMHIQAKVRVVHTDGQEGYTICTKKLNLIMICFW